MTLGQSTKATESNSLADQGPSEYDSLTELDWAEGEFATIEYDYKIHPEASRRISGLLKQVSKCVALEEMPDCELEFKSKSDMDAWNAWKKKYAHLMGV